VPAGTARRDIAWALLTDLAGRRRGTVPIVNPCPRCGGPHGPVVLDGTDLLGSVSYTGDVAVAAVIPAAAAAGFGIDAESANSWDDTPGREVLGRPADLREWTRVEAALKADGRGLRVEASRVVVAPAPAGWRATVPGSAGVMLGWDVPAPAPLVVSAAVVPALPG
jgi:4'-phosphopantetheinyl transferase